MSKNQGLKGGSFIVSQEVAKNVFIPEEFSEEQKMLGEMVQDFCNKEIHSMGSLKVAKLNAEDNMDIVKDTFQKASDLGLCGVSIAERFGGLGLDFNTGLVFSENIAQSFSFATTIGAQTSIGSLPIVYYGNEDQKEKYLPGIASGELVAAYALTEPTAGSDANSGKTHATLNKEGTHYILNGQKMWITNGGFADVFIVFAKIDDDKNLSAFIVEKAFGGIEIGKEEAKLGIKASSTVQLFFTNCEVPIENLLGERQGGFKMALNILNSGRIKLAAGSVGGIKYACDKSVEYAKQRVQFNKPISDFGAVQQKIGQMATLAFAVESAVYRTGYNIDQKHQELIAAGASENDASINALREYAIECAILKVVGSEGLAYAVDQGIQIFGGMGYSMEAGMEMGYRDARITRIYEGTNEINRMLSVAELMKRAYQAKEIDLMGATKGVPVQMFSAINPFNAKGFLGKESEIVENLKKLFLLVSAAAGRKLKLKLVDEQEIVMNLADILGQTYVAESALLRVKKLQEQGADKDELETKKAIVQLYIYEALAIARKSAEDAIASYAKGTEKFVTQRLADTLTMTYDVNPKDLRRQVAQAVINAGKYPF
ncbi:MAG: acyl-CoA dehydrogenase family protein [Chitinophagales bacterium]|nr:acyl-CoA dehydrogenase family protein [Chitinophagales bacterium]